jgi:hypothetical protein
LGNGGLNERGEKSATIELILDTKPIADGKLATPLRIDFAIEIEIPPMEGHISRNYEEGEAYPKEESIDGEEGTVVKEDTGPADYRSDDAKAGSDRRCDEFAAVANSDDVGVFPDVKPSTKKKDGACKGISRELRAMVTEGEKRKSASAEITWWEFNSIVVVTAVELVGDEDTHKEIGKKECPLEPVPTKAGLGAPTLLTEKASLDAVVVLVTLPWHSSFATAKSFTPSATFWTGVQTLAAILEAIVKDGVWEFGRKIVDGEGLSGLWAKKRRSCTGIGGT